MLKTVLSSVTKNFTDDSKIMDFGYDEGIYFGIDLSKDIKGQVKRDNILQVELTKDKKLVPDNVEKELQYKGVIPYLYNTEFKNFISLNDITRNSFAISFPINYIYGILYALDTDLDIPNILPKTKTASKNDLKKVDNRFSQILKRNLEYFYLNKYSIKNISDLNKTPLSKLFKPTQVILSNVVKQINGLNDKDVKGINIEEEYVKLYNSNRDKVILKSIEEYDKTFGKMYSGMPEWLVSEERNNYIEGILKYIDDNSDYFDKDFLIDIVKGTHVKDDKGVYKSKANADKYFYIIIDNLPLDVYKRESELCDSISIRQTNSSKKNLINITEDGYAVRNNSKLRSLDSRKAINVNLTSGRSYFEKLDLKESIYLNKFINYLNYNYRNLVSYEENKKFFVLGDLVKAILYNYDGDINNKSKDGVLVYISKDTTGVSFHKYELYTASKKKILLKYKNYSYNKDNKIIIEDKLIKDLNSLRTELNNVYFNGALNVVDIKDFSKNALTDYIIRYRKIFNSLDKTDTSMDVLFNRMPEDLDKIILVMYEHVSSYGYNNVKYDYKVGYINMLNAFSLRKSILTNMEKDFYKSEDLYNRYVNNEENVIHNDEDMLFVISNLAKTISDKSKTSDKNIKLELSYGVMNVARINQSMNKLNRLYFRYKHEFDNPKNIEKLLKELKDYVKINNKLNKKLTRKDRVIMVEGLISKEMMYVKKGGNGKNEK